MDGFGFSNCLAIQSSVSGEPGALLDDFKLQDVTGECQG